MIKIFLILLLMSVPVFALEAKFANDDLSCEVADLHISWGSYTGFKIGSPLHTTEMFTDLSYQNYSVSLNQSYDTAIQNNNNCSIMVFNSDIIFTSQMYTDYIVINDHTLKPGATSFLLQVNEWPYDIITFSLQTDYNQDCIYSYHHNELVARTNVTNHLFIFDNMTIAWECVIDKIYITKYRPFTLEGYFTINDDETPSDSSSSTTANEMPLIFVIVLVALLLTILLGAICILSAYVKSFCKDREKDSKSLISKEEKNSDYDNSYD